MREARPSFGEEVGGETASDQRTVSWFGRRRSRHEGQAGAFGGSEIARQFRIAPGSHFSTTYVLRSVCRQTISGRRTILLRAGF
jgi:hypothetical protein